ncbi:MAG: hypothetical protein K2L77_09450, partial [Muribaculaceae bacterium]|nr:hypothetical protein [Muribaculaceae bacterium]
MILRWAVLSLLAVIPYAAVAAATAADSVWVKVPVESVDSVWIKIPASGSSTGHIACDAPVSAGKPASVSVPAMQSAGLAARRQAWSRKYTDDPRRVVFSWGAEAGSSIDMSENDMSSVDINATFGLRYR